MDTPHSQAVTSSATKKGTKRRVCEEDSGREKVKGSSPSKIRKLHDNEANSNLELLSIATEAHKSSRKPKANSMDSTDMNDANAPFSCSMCASKFMTMADLLKHKNDAHLPASKSSIPCNVCKLMFCSIKELLAHHADAHPSDETNCSSPSPSESSVAENQTQEAGSPNTAQDLLKESQIKSETSPLQHRPSTGSNPMSSKLSSNFECDICQKAFASRQGLQNHVQTVHLKKRTFQCKECSKKFSANGSLKRHIDTVHRGERKFDCRTCHKSFALKHHLKNHVLTVHQQKSASGGAVDNLQESNDVSLSPDPRVAAAVAAAGLINTAQTNFAGLNPLLLGARNSSSQGLEFSGMESAALQALIARQILQSQALSSRNTGNSPGETIQGNLNLQKFAPGSALMHGTMPASQQSNSLLMALINQRDPNSSSSQSPFTGASNMPLQNQQQQLSAFAGTMSGLNLPSIPPTLGVSVLDQLMQNQRAQLEQATNSPKRKLGNTNLQTGFSGAPTSETKIFTNGNASSKIPDVPIVPFPPMSFGKKQLNEKGSPSSDGSESPTSYSSSFTSTLA